MSIATIDGYAFPYNPNRVKWGYTVNVSSQNTLGGRVVQILSTRIDSLMWQGDAGSRDALLGLYEKIQKIMAYHVETKRPVTLHVPARQWSFNVYVRSLPRVGWGVDTVKYPYDLSFEIDEDFGHLSKVIMSNELKKLAVNIGYDQRWSGPQAFSLQGEFLE